MGSKNTNWLLIIIIGVVAFLFLNSQGMLANLNLPNYTGNPNPYPYPTPTPYNPYPTPTSGGQSGNSLAPTSLTVNVSPNPVVVRHGVYGSVTSNGYNTPIVVHARHTGAEEWTNGGTQEFGALLGSDGKYEHVQQLNIAGYWEFWVTCGSVTSNVFPLTCTGITVTINDESVSKSGSPSTYMCVFSNIKNTQVSFIANDPVHSMSIPLQTVNTDDTGSVSVMYNFASFAVGSYEIDAVIGGQKASDFAGSVWLEVTA